ncbi:putative acyltransferase [Streptomyces sp. NBRC 110611]|uniref:acyltransferase family protein n=1 Tax=Streptomyces sp. NBRC 110611 TaxID=1621259 RepID=UPI00085778D9|nr:acyltransferase [Streptomyces sp. NBRC 110611]GAU67067.1 putative acyltransferase [Streptomyces sp. NBRC 110611]
MSTETAPAPGRATAIDGLRALAALSTVAFHVWQQYTRHDARGSHPPVDDPLLGAVLSLEVIDLFFVLSAYLLTLPYARAALDGRPVRPARLFLFRRAIRILPLYVVAVLVVWASRNPTLPGNWRDLVEHLTFTHVFDQQRIFYTIGPTWSLSLEVLFYLVLVGLGPPAVRACRPLQRRGSRVAACAAGCALLFAAPLAWIAVARYGLGVPHTDWVAYFGPQARFGGFAAGMGLAVATAALGDRGRLGPRGALPLAALALAGLLALALHSGPESFTATFYHPIASALWTVLVFSTVHIRRTNALQRVLTARRLTAVGLVSYSLFIWHEPVMRQLYQAGLLPAGPSGFPYALLIVYLVALPVAAVSYWLLEYPAGLLGRLRDSRGRPREFYPEPAAR